MCLICGHICAQPVRTAASNGLLPQAVALHRRRYDTVMPLLWQGDQA